MSQDKKALNAQAKGAAKFLLDHVVNQEIKPKFEFDEKAVYEASFNPENVSVIDHNYFVSGAHWQFNLDKAKLELALAQAEKLAELVEKLCAIDDSYAKNGLCHGFRKHYAGAAIAEFQNYKAGLK